MPIIFTDEEIQKFLKEPKILPEDYHETLKLKPRYGHNVASIKINGQDNSKFTISLRQCIQDKFNYSAILGYEIPGTSTIFRLRRYNSKSHEHTNKIEKVTFFDYHVHIATQRYQENGLREDEYAIRTSSYIDLHGALQALINECSFVLPRNSQISF